MPAPYRVPVLVALATDVALVLVFAHVGRADHDEPATVAGLLGTVWPFLAGLATGWLVARAVPRPALRAVVLVVVLWGTAMLLRLVSGQGVSGAFPVVALAMLAALLLGWRLIVAIAARRLNGRGPRRSAVPAP